jgi:hypothetical protein
MMLCSTPFAGYDATKGMTTGAILSGAGAAVLGLNSMVPYGQFFTGSMLAGAAFDYYCRKDSFGADTRLAQEMLAAAAAGYLVLMVL